MKKLLTILAALAILASGTANAQVAERLTAHRLDRPWTFSSFVAPPGCVSTSVPFFGSAVTLGCDGGLTYDSTGRALTTETVKATSYAAQAKTVTITGATNATPIVVTATAHGLYTDDLISISGITGNTNANGFFKVTRLTADTFSLQNYSTGADIAGNGAYGGTPVAVTGIVYAPRVFVGDGAAAQPSVTFGAQSTTGIYRETSGNYAGMTFVVTGTNVFDFVGGTAGGTQFAQIRNGSFKAPSTGGFVWSSTTDVTSADDLILTRPAAATLQLGAADVNGSPVAQTLKVQSAITGTNLAPAAWTLRGSLGTGNATPGAINITSGGRSATSGTTAQTAVTREGIGWSKVLTNNSAIAVVNATLASNTGMGMIVRYLVEVFDGTNLQTESGVVSINGVNKAGAFTIATPTKAGNVQALSSGTLAVTWAASSANPSVISVNANSSLTPSTGYPRITYTIDNLSQQAVAMQ